jgi:hypothetical protein
MKTFLRDIRTGLFLKACGEWTPDRTQAQNFKLINTAIKRADKMGLRGVELVVTSADQTHLTVLPVGMLDSTRPMFGRYHD